MIWTPTVVEQLWVLLLLLLLRAMVHEIQYRGDNGESIRCCTLACDSIRPSWDPQNYYPYSDSSRLP